MAGSAILTLNAGSSSLKFALFATGIEMTRLLDGTVERIGEPGARLEIHDQRSGNISQLTGELLSHRAAFAAVLEQIGLVGSSLQITAVGHRFAHGGPDCDCPKLVTAELVRQIERLVPLAPLHLPANLAGIAAVSAERPELRQIACFDTAFHRNLPRLAQMTGLPRTLETPELRRYGYHGLSYEYILSALQRDGFEVGTERIVVAHLGNGASLAAIRAGRSVETTMGFSTISGVPMGSRSGDIDPGLLLHLQRDGAMSAAQVEDLLTTGAGLLGLSGFSRDIRELMNRRDPVSAEAIRYFCYHVRRHLAGLTASIEGLDRLVFTGGIGANSAPVRALVCTGLGYLGLSLDETANTEGHKIISGVGSRVVVEVRQTDEEAMIAKHVTRLCSDCANDLKEIT